VIVVVVVEETVVTIAKQKHQLLFTKMKLAAIERI
jgi:hypothetical protein